jgi:hypothetical protein
MDEEKARELARVLKAASEQIGLALLDSHKAVDTLGSSLERLALLLSGDLATPKAAAELAELRAEMARAVTGLQFYDRMTQHLSHVRDYLAGTVDQLSSASSTFETLNRRLADRLLSDTHRIHLGRNFSVDFLARRKQAVSAGERTIVPQGDIDLF